MTEASRSAVAAALQTHPLVGEEIAGFLGSASDRFGELAALFSAIRTLTNDPQGVALIAKLCALGICAADDYENFYDRLREDVEKGGVRHE